jgi:hypothetical protein
MRLSDLDASSLDDADIIISYLPYFYAHWPLQEVFVNIYGRVLRSARMIADAIEKGVFILVLLRSFLKDNVGCCPRTCSFMADDAAD